MNMKNVLLLAGFLCLTAIFFACRKKTIIPEESQGTRFERLLKTVTKSSNSPYDLITEYSYTTGGQIATIVIRSRDAVTGKASLATETFFRNGSGRIDSIIYKTVSEGSTTESTKTYFYYQPSGTAGYSVFVNETAFNPGESPATDSSLYQYSGNRMIKRTDYRKFVANPYFLLRTFDYEYDAAGNMQLLRATYTSPAQTDTVRLTFDNKINPLPVIRGVYDVGYWGPGFYNDYSFINNPLSKQTRDWTDYTYEYRYTANNKPLFQKIKQVGTTVYSDVYFYYD
jgi:hypothetical protein